MASVKCDPVIRSGAGLQPSQPQLCFGSLGHHAATCHLHFGVVAHQKCDDA
jgi:hypothetical protein